MPLKVFVHFMGTEVKISSHPLLIHKSNNKETESIFQIWLHIIPKTFFHECWDNNICKSSSIWNLRTRIMKMHIPPELLIPNNGKRKCGLRNHQRQLATLSALNNKSFSVLLVPFKKILRELRGFRFFSLRIFRFNDAFLTKRLSHIFVYASVMFLHMPSQ